MRSVLAAVLGIWLVAGMSGRACAQGLVEYVLILVLNESPAGGLRVGGIHASSALTEDLCVNPGQDAVDLCRVVGEFEVGMPAASALSRSFGAGLQDLIFTPLSPARPGQGAAAFAGAFDRQLYGGTTEHIVLHTLIGTDEVSLDTCRYTRRQEIVHVVQQRSGVDPGAGSEPDEAASQPCVDVIQEGLLQGLALIAATPVASVRSGATALTADAAEAEIDVAAQNRSLGRRIAAYLIFRGPPPLP